MRRSRACYLGIFSGTEETDITFRSEDGSRTMTLEVRKHSALTRDHGFTLKGFNESVHLLIDVILNKLAAASMLL